jgi:hypothetical protein
MPYENKKDASWYFHHPDYGYNCAQAITYRHGESAEALARMSQNGGGRAPEGLCGALYGGLFILRNHPEDQQKLKEAFCSEIGSAHCREIRSRRLASCKQCIEAADQALEKIRDKAPCLIEE